MNYTLAHLKIAHLIGSNKASFEEVTSTIALLERNGIIDANGNWISLVHVQPAREPSAVNATNDGEKRRRLGRGGLTKMIVGYLQSKGNEGARVKEIAAAINSNQANVRIWFYRTGRELMKAGEIKKIGRAKFAYLGGGII